MKKSALLASLLAAVSLAAGAAVLKTDPAKSSVSAVFKQMNVPVEGRFKRFGGQVAFDPARPAAARASLDIELASIDAGSPEANDEVGGKLFGVILNNVNIKTDDNYYYYAGYSTSYYGYRKRTPRGRGGKEAVASKATPEAEPQWETSSEDHPPTHGTSAAPKITYQPPPQGESEDRF